MRASSPRGRRSRAAQGVPRRADPPSSSRFDPMLYRVTHLLGKNLPLTWFRQFRQLVGCYCSYLLPRQDGGTSQYPSQQEVFTKQMGHPIMSDHFVAIHQISVGLVAVMGQAQLKLIVKRRGIVTAYRHDALLKKISALVQH